MGIKKVYQTKINMLQYNASDLCKTLENIDGLTVVNNNDRTIYLKGACSETINDVIGPAINTWYGGNITSSCYNILPLDSNSCLLMV